MIDNGKYLNITLFDIDVRCSDEQTKSLNQAIKILYKLYDNKGKAVLFEEGFPIEAEKDGKTYEAWAGYHGLHVHSTSGDDGEEDTTGKTLFKKFNVSF